MEYRFFAALLLVCQACTAGRVSLGMGEFERQVLRAEPRLKEKAIDIEKSRQQLDELATGAILPKFDVEIGMGPAPGLRPRIDTTYIYGPGGMRDSLVALSTGKDYNFHSWGPFYGVELSVAQPLNVARYRAGRKAAESQVRVSQADFQKQRMDVSEDAQKLYYNFLFATTMLAQLDQAAKDLDRAQSTLQDLVDSGAQNVSQNDLLELKAGRYALEKNRNDARAGLRQAELDAGFLLQLPDSQAFAPADSQLAQRPEALPALDSLQKLTLYHHPDLQRLNNGLAARQELIRVAEGELGPDFFLFGDFKYSKAWSSYRESGGSDPFAKDPLNELTGVGGLGLRLHLNFWERYQGVRKQRLELKQLKRTEAYAARGLLLRLEEAYARFAAARSNVAEAQKSLRASEALLKSAAMKYDLDPSTAKDLVAPYKNALFARRDYYQAVLDYNLAVAAVIKAVGWTLSDYFHNLGGQAPPVTGK